jgi:hypothetical protein
MNASVRTELVAVLDSSGFLIEGRNNVNAINRDVRRRVRCLDTLEGKFPPESGVMPFT